jgi:hypothetical protein
VATPRCPTSSLWQHGRLRFIDAAGNATRRGPPWPPVIGPTSSFEKHGHLRLIDGAWKRNEGWPRSATPTKELLSSYDPTIQIAQGGAILFLQLNPATTYLQLNELRHRNLFEDRIWNCCLQSLNHSF